MVEDEAVILATNDLQEEEIDQVKVGADSRKNPKKIKILSFFFVYKEMTDTDTSTLNDSTLSN